jgi:tryptophan synthase alpha chain
MPANRVRAVFDRLKSEGRSAFISYLCAGDPDFDTSLASMQAVVEAGTDILEIGVPFSDPLADGLTNQLAAERALSAGMDQPQVLALVKALRSRGYAVPVVLYTYYNLVFSSGLEAYCQALQDAQVDGLLVLDLPPEEAVDLQAACARYGIALVFIIAPTTPPQRIPVIAEATTGFIYYVSRTGVTGAQAHIANDLSLAVERIRKHTDLPVAVGFGISTPEHVQAVAKVADGVIVGSAIVGLIADNLPEPQQIPEALGARVRWLRGA